MKNIRKAIPILQALCSLREPQRRIILAHVNDETCAYVCQAVDAVLHCETLTRHKKEKLKRLLSNNKKHYRYIAKKKNCMKKKKNILPHLGAGLGWLLSAAIPLLIQLLSK